MVQYTTEMDIYLVGGYFSFATYLKYTWSIPHGQSIIVTFLLINVHLHMQRGTYWHCVALTPSDPCLCIVYCGINGMSHALVEVLHTLISSTGPLDARMLSCIVRDQYVSWHVTRMYFCCLLLLPPYTLQLPKVCISLSIIWYNISTSCIERK